MAVKTLQSSELWVRAGVVSTQHSALSIQPLKSISIFAFAYGSSSNFQRALGLMTCPRILKCVLAFI
jgi:hypothetical protein